MYIYIHICTYTMISITCTCNNIYPDIIYNIGVPGNPYIGPW